jgi:hypothetical protein
VLCPGFISSEEIVLKSFAFLRVVVDKQSTTRMEWKVKALFCCWGREMFLLRDKLSGKKIRDAACCHLNPCVLHSLP